MTDEHLLTLTSRVEAQGAQKIAQNINKEANKFDAFWKNSQNINVRLCTVTNESIVGQDQYQGNALHTARNEDNVAKPTISRQSADPHSNMMGQCEPRP